MENGGNSPIRFGTDRDSSENETAFADHLLTSPEFPAYDDWEGWTDLYCGPDTGTIDCVPACLRPAILPFMGSDGRLLDDESVCETPYSLARFMNIGNSHRPPWSGTGLTPWAAKEALDRGIPGWAIKEAALKIRDKGAEVALAESVPADGFADLYFIRSKGGPIKIGVSAEPERRLRALQTANPHKLELVCIVHGAARLEPEYHQRFAEHRLNGEWFSPHPDILAEINRLNSLPTPSTAGRVR